ncbi:DUF2510 domain-containing protein [Nocardia sp. NPDC055053]
MVNTCVAQAPPGWYLDPQAAMRWFDGRKWTEPVHPGTPSAPAPEHTPPPPQE